MRFNKAIVAAGLLALSLCSARAETVTNHAFAIGKGPGVTGYTSLLCTSAQLAVGQTAADPICQTITGDVTITAGGVTAIGATKVTTSMLNANVFSTAHTWSAQQTFTSTGIGEAIVTSQSGTGVPTADPNSIGFAYNHIYVPSAGVDVSGFAAGQKVSTGLVVDVYPNNGSKGNVQGIYGAVHIPSSATVDTTGDWGYAGVQGVAQADINLGGSIGTQKGSVFGGGLQAVANASYLFGAVGLETDMVALSTATGLARRLGVSSADASGAGGVSGSLYDASFAVGASATSPGWTNGLLFSDNNGGAPIKSTGTLIATSGTHTVRSFIDFTSYSCSGGGMFVHNLFLVDCVGNLFAGGTIKSPLLTLNGSSSGTTSLQAAATASGTLTLPAATDTLVGKATTDTLTNKTLTSPVVSTILNSGTLTLPTSTDTLLGRATTDTLTNKTIDTAGAGNVFKINGTQVSATTGSGSTVPLGTSPSFTTSLNINGNLQLNGTNVLNESGGSTTPYVFFVNPLAGENIFIGGGGGSSPDHTNYYQNASHVFRSEAGAAVLATLDNKSHLGYTATAPVISGCGTAPSVARGTDSAGEVTEGTTATGCTVTFANSGYTAAPYCVVSSQAALSSFAYTISTTALVITHGSASSTKINWLCHGN